MAMVDQHGCQRGHRHPHHHGTDGASVECDTGEVHQADCAQEDAELAVICPREQNNFAVSE